jgi:hypothetical protein
MQTVNISIARHSDGTFTVGKAGKSTAFKTREEAEAHAIQIQTEAGGPDKAKIIVRDLTKERGDEPPISSLMAAFFAEDLSRLEKFGLQPNMSPEGAADWLLYPDSLKSRRIA